MTFRLLTPTVAANGSRIGFAMLFLIAAALLAAATLVEIGQALFGLVDLHCAACVADNGMGGVGVTAGTVGIGLVIGGSVGGGGGLGGFGGVSVRYERSGDSSLFGPDDVGGANSRHPMAGIGDGLGDIARTIERGVTRPGGPTPDVSRRLEKWTVDLTDELRGDAVLPPAPREKS